MVSISDKKTPIKVDVFPKNDKEWWEDYTPCEDYLKQVSFIASIGTGFALSASVALAGSSTFQGRTDNTTIALIASTSQIFAWGGSAYAVALVASIIGILTTEVKAVVVVLQVTTEQKNEPWDNNYTCGAVILYWLLATASLGFTVAGTVLTGIGLNILAGGSGTMLQWSLFVVGFPMCLLGLILYCYANKIMGFDPTPLIKKKMGFEKDQREASTMTNRMWNTLDQ
jgi:hypothetical protein